MPFHDLMRRYSFAYTASHDFSQLASLMVGDYLLRMGEHEIRGRDTAYRAATQRQYDQFPGLGFTVHRLVTNGERLALVFTEHGASRRHGGLLAAWRGVSLYHWDGTRLLDCTVEQDYFARRRQLADGVPDPVGTPGHDPWSNPVEPEDATVLDSVMQWLREGGLDSAPTDRFNDGPAGADPVRPVLADARWTVLDAFSAGPEVPFAARVDGVYDGGLARSRRPARHSRFSLLHRHRGIQGRRRTSRTPHRPAGRGGHRPDRTRSSAHVRPCTMTSANQADI